MHMAATAMMDERIETQDVARVTRADLATRGKTECVQVLLECDSMFDDTLIPLVKRILRPDARITLVKDEKKKKDK